MNICLQTTAENSQGRCSCDVARLFVPDTCSGGDRKSAVADSLSLCMTVGQWWR